ncbi:PRC-barrel domain-containing protein [Celeribacter indicus]|uniref:PRC-barrel domain-containing protein n=1 Tax=Celeribacter indicus TaxID=1208324 RepID=A0A0B5DPP6_9RHOB|nr:PRC-barrel domain-containing protein [Celeribacter indicus]AJE45543.1 hypothetical protein P73_0828 [Celeribacter indicus]SDW86403.1 PRC-barrel domain-containing protein [Celeribacter indicus]
MKKLFATTALGLCLAMPAVAQDTAPDPNPATDEPAATTDMTTDQNMSAQTGGDVFYGSVEHAVMASDFIGKRVYSTESDVDTSANMTDADENWEDIGEISDVVISLNGDVEAVLVDVGGFLGMGEKTVAVNLDELNMVPDGDSADDYFLVLTGSRAALEEAPEYQEQTNDTIGADGSTTLDGTTDGAAVTGTPGTTTDPAADPLNNETGATDRAMTEDRTDGTAGTGAAMTDEDQLAAWDEFTAEDLTGQTVYGTNGDEIGEIGDVVLDDEMKVSQIIVDVGGFLGIGEKQVALDPSQIQLQQDGDNITLHVESTEEELEQMPEYDI